MTNPNCKMLVLETLYIVRIKIKVIPHYTHTLSPSPGEKHSQSLPVLHSKYLVQIWSHFIAGLTARLEALSMVPPTVDLAILVEVDEVHKELPAGGAHKTLRVPTGTMPCPAGKNGNVPTTDLLPTLK